MRDKLANLEEVVIADFSTTAAAFVLSTGVGAIPGSGAKSTVMSYSVAVFRPGPDEGPWKSTL